MSERNLSYLQAKHFIDNTALRNVLLFNLHEIRDGDQQLLPSEISLQIVSQLSPLTPNELYDLACKTTDFLLYKNRSMRLIDGHIKNSYLPSSLSLNYREVKNLLERVKSTKDETELLDVLNAHMDLNPTFTTRLWNRASGITALYKQLKGVQKALQSRHARHGDSSNNNSQSKLPVKDNATVLSS